MKPRSLKFCIASLTASGRGPAECQKKFYAHELAWGVALSARAGCESAGAEVAARRDAAMDAMVPKLQLVAIQLCVVHLLRTRCPRFWLLCRLDSQTILVASWMLRMCWICAALPRGLLPYTQRLGIPSGLVLWTVAPLRRRAKQLHGGLIRFWKSFSS